MTNKYFLLFICMITFISCGQQKESAFTGEMKKTTAPVGTIPDESIYNLTDTFVNQDNQAVQLKDFAGKPTVLCMIFTHCTYACPRLTADVKHIEEKLGNKADDVHFVLVSFDVERDTPEQLKKFQQEMKLDDRFTLLHGDEEAVRTLSVLMNVQYQKNSNGDFSHSNVISVLGRDGRLLTQKEGINAPQETTVKLLEDLL